MGIRSWLSKLSPTTAAKLPPGAQVLPQPVQLNIPQIMPTGGSHTITDAVSGYWYSALQPIKPMAPEGQRVRQFGFAPGANIIWTPKTETEGTGPGFPILRSFADSWDLLRLVIETVKDRLCTAQFEFRVIRKKGEKEGQWKDRGAADPRLQQLMTFFSRPDGEHCWADWLRPLLEDMLVIDAASIYMERDTRRRIASLRYIDGGTIGRMLTDQGFTPPYPQVAYQQVLYGIPAHDMTVNDLVYAVRNVRTHRRYGFSPVEQMMITISIGLSRQKFQLDYYTAGNIPEALCFLPADVPIQRIKETQQWFDSIFSGDLAARRRLTFLPGYGSGKEARPNVIFPKEVLLKDPMDEWLFQAVCYGLGTTPQAMLRLMNRATAQQSAESSEEEGLMPKLTWIANTMNLIVQQKMGFQDIEFAWAQQREVDIVKQAAVDKIYVGSGVQTINEIRENLGKDPFPYAEANEPGVMTPNGFIPLTAGMVNQPGAQGSGKGPAGKEMLANMQEHQEDQQAQQEEQADQSHQRALELQNNKQKQLQQPPPGKGKHPASKSKAAARKSYPPALGADGHCVTHAKYVDGCFRCALADLHRTEELYELIET